MKNWLSIGDFSKETGLSIKTLRHYQEIDLLNPHARGENNYRYYTTEQIQKALKIRDYKAMGFSLEEIKAILNSDHDQSLIKIIQNRLQEISQQQIDLSEQKNILTSILTSLDTGLELSIQQKEFIMEEFMQRGVDGLKRRGVIPSSEIVQKMEDEINGWLPIQGQVLEAIRAIMDYAKKNNILLGPGRGSSGSSLFLFSEGYTQINPLKYGLIPEVYSGAKYVWLDVEFSRSKEIGEITRKFAKELDYGLVAFKEPLLDIFSRVQEKVGLVDFDSYADDSELVLSAFKQKDLRGIRNYDWTSNYAAFKRMSEDDQKKYTRDQKEFENWSSTYDITTVDDIHNIGYLYEAMGHDELVKYAELKSSKVLYPFLKESSQKILHNSHGMLLWREDWIRILSDYTGLSYYDSNQVYKAVLNKNLDAPELAHLMLLQDSDVKDLLLNQANDKVFMKSHIVLGFWYTKRCAILKSLWPEVYLQAIEDWEQEHGMVWQEFGYIVDGVPQLEA